MNNQNNQKTAFRTCNFYKTVNGSFYAIAEGNLTRDPSFSNSEDKTHFISTSMGCGDYPISTRARSAGMAIPEGVDITFANLKFFGAKAKALYDNAKKGDRLIVAGRVEYASRESNGKTYHNLTINVDEFAVRSKGSDTIYSSGGIARFTNVYTSATNTENTRPMLANFIGEVMSAEEHDYNSNGETKTLLRVNIRTDNDPRQAYDLATGTNGEGYKTTGSSYMNVTLFGKTAERAIKCLNKGAVVAFTGQVRSYRNEDTGKIYYAMTADTFIILQWADKEDEPKRTSAEETEPNKDTVSTNQEVSEPAASDTTFDNDLDDEDDDDGTLPF